MPRTVRSARHNAGRTGDEEQAASGALDTFGLPTTSLTPPSILARGGSRARQWRFRSHDARIVQGILGRPEVRLRLRGYSGPGIWDCPITRQPPSSPRARVTPMSYGPLRRSSTSARSPIVGGRDGPPRRTFRFADIKRGWLVEDSDETSLGTVVSSGEILLTVSRGFLSSKLYLPPSAVAEVHEGIVRLNVTSEWVKAQGWDRAGSRKER